MKVNILSIPVMYHVFWSVRLLGRNTRPWLCSADFRKLPCQFCACDNSDFGDGGCSTGGLAVVLLCFKDGRQHHPITKNMFLNNQALWANNQHPKHHNNFADWFFLGSKDIHGISSLNGVSKFHDQNDQKNPKYIKIPYDYQNACFKRWQNIPWPRSPDPSLQNLRLACRSVGPQITQIHHGRFVGNMFQPTIFSNILNVHYLMYWKIVLI